MKKDLLKKAINQRKRIGLIRDYTEGEENKALVLWIFNLLIASSIIAISILSFTTAYNKSNISKENKSLYSAMGFISIIFLIVFLIPKYFKKINIFYIFYLLLGLIILGITLVINYGENHIYRTDKYLNGVNVTIIVLIAFIIITALIGLYLFYSGEIENSQNDITTNPKLYEELIISQHYLDVFNSLNLKLDEKQPGAIDNGVLDRLKKIEMQLTGEIIIDNNNFAQDHPEEFLRRITDLKNMITAKTNSKKRFLKGLTKLKNDYNYYQEKNKINGIKGLMLTNDQKNKMQKKFNDFKIYLLSDTTNNYITNKLEDMLSSGDYFTSTEYIDVFGLPERNTEFSVLGGKQIISLSKELSNDIVNKEKELTKLSGIEKDKLQEKIDSLKEERERYMNTIAERKKNEKVITEGMFRAEEQLSTQIASDAYIKELAGNNGQGKITSVLAAKQLINYYQKPAFKSKFDMLDREVRNNIQENYESLVDDLRKKVDDNNKDARKDLANNDEKKAAKTVCEKANKDLKSITTSNEGNYNFNSPAQ